MDRTQTIQRLTRILRIGMYILATIGILMVLRRILAMAGIIPSFNRKGAAPFDTGFSQHPVITLMHILPGALFMILGPALFMPEVQTKHPELHHQLERLFMIDAYIVGVSALYMPFVMLPIGGINEAAASTLFGLYFLLALTLAWRANVQHRKTQHREWMIRTFAIGLAIATVRPIVGMFFALTALAPQIFFGTAFWIGFTLHLMVAEAWINYTRPAVSDAA
ncbi:DUF2306 domain-containing protein [Chitinophaga flava]|uniref:DUF2306 domain-containing protein n=1 Tax=Chitinophaga flava TaxID=2259036 RepID=A0A365XTW4_9BACT|nr:DUF2306 domain-containing protein [Chitinophaga flava]RBL89817.1 hypothetical protein DF182_25365 [Chitinophaga flava]